MVKISNSHHYRTKGAGAGKTRKNPHIVKAIKHQSGKRKSIKRDKERKSMPPGLRVSVRNKPYWETRKNRSDLNSML